MGVNGLWELVARAAVTRSLYRLAVHKKSTSSNSMVIGVDMSTVMAECVAAAMVPGISGQLHGGGLYIFFTKLAAYLEFPFTLVFVFDGNERPSIKRGAHVSASKPPSWMELAKELITYMGYHYHQAPGEAEAELSALNKLGLIDAVMTSDSDTLVFGAPLIFRTITSSKAEFPGQIRVYDSVCVADSDNGVSLTRGGLLLIALLCGGDYDLNGLQGCGPAIAYGLARCGFGDQLLEGFHQGLTSGFLDFWRERVQKELNTNSRNFLPSRQPRLASNIPNHFPDPKVIELYVQPVTSCTPPHVLPNAQFWRPKEPMIHLLTKFCYENFGWRTEETLKVKFSSLLWDGVFSQMIYSPLVQYDPLQKCFRTPKHKATVQKSSLAVRKGKFTQMMGESPVVKFVISSENFVALMSANFMANEDDEVTAWVPREFVPLQALTNLETNVSTRVKGGRGHNHALIIKGKNRAEHAELLDLPECLDVRGKSVTVEEHVTSEKVVDEVAAVQGGQGQAFGKGSSSLRDARADGIHGQEGGAANASTASKFRKDKKGKGKTLTTWETRSPSPMWLATYDQRTPPIWIDAYDWMTPVEAAGSAVRHLGYIDLTVDDNDGQMAAGSSSQVEPYGCIHGRPLNLGFIDLSEDADGQRALREVNGSGENDVIDLTGDSD